MDITIRQVTFFSSLTSSFVCGILSALVSLNSAAEQNYVIQAGSEYDYPPFCLVTKDGQADGFSVELLRAALQAVGHDVRYKVDAWNVLKKDLEEGRIEALPLVARNAERAKVFGFTPPYFSLRGAIFVRTGEKRIWGADDLLDKTVAVMKSDTGEEYVNSHRLSDKVEATETLEKAFALLVAGSVDAVVASKLVGENMVAKFNNVTVAGPPLEKFQEFCFAVRIGNAELLADLNEGLSIIVANGTRERLREKWFMPMPHEGALLARQLVIVVLVTLLLSGLVAYLRTRKLRAKVKAGSKDLKDEMQLRYQAEEELKASESLFRNYFNLAQVGMCITSSEHKWLKVNAHICDILGYTAEELLNLTWSELTHPDDLSADLSHYMRLLKGEIEQYALDKRFIHKSGRIVFTHLTVTCKRGADGRVEYVIASVEDISERKKAEQETRIAATVFDAQEGMVVTAIDGTILKVNNAFSRITGYTSEEAVGKNPRILKSGRQDEAFYRRMWAQINDIGVWEGEIWNRRKDGEIYPEYLAITAVKDSAGNVTNYVATFNDITLSKASADEIKNLAYYDSLTKLPNRRLLLDHLRKALATIDRSGDQGALLFLDLDNFKNLNDTLGHDIGDLLLQQVGERLEACVRKEDTVARLGGDEFVVMLENLSKKDIDAAAQAEAIANKILATLNQTYQLQTHAYQISPSIGITMMRNHDQGVEGLLKQADIAMYQAKKEGKNTTRFFDPMMQESLRERVKLESDLCQALADMQFELHFQIQVDSSNRTIGAEALVRWQHPERGLLLPADFIPHAEESGLILSIGNWVLESACKLLKAWQQDETLRDLVLSINVSAKQFHQTDFANHIMARVAHYGLDGSRLKLELTESLLLVDTEDTISKINALGGAGIRLSLDDFGTGYSSLQYLKRLPLEQLKIDKSFIQDIETDADDRAIVSTIIAMAHTLGVEVIAEGVETEVQRQFLAERGCRRFQGYLFGRPTTIEQFVQSMKK